MPPRNICVTAVDGQTGFLIAELLLTSPDFHPKLTSLIGLSLHPTSPRAKELSALGAASIAAHIPGNVAGLVSELKRAKVDTLCLVPPAHADKKVLCEEMVEAAKQAGVQNVCLISSAGCEYADKEKQPRLREFIELESLVLATKGDPDVELGHSPCVIRAGFYAENLLLYAPQAQKDGVLPLPIGPKHKFAPVALGDIAQVAAHVLTGHGEHGFDDRHRGQMMVLTGPMLCAGEELASAASEALGVEMQFKDVSEKDAKSILKSQSDSDESEKEYVLEYYSLVREGKTNYIATTAFHDVTGGHPTELVDFFKMYQGEMHPRKKKKTS